MESTGKKGTRRHGRPRLDEADTISRNLIAVATREFATHGFEGASINRIAAAAGTFKSTIYRRYATKAELFENVLAHESSVFVRNLEHDVDCTQPVERVLFTMARALLNQASAPDSRAIFRLLVAESSRFPDLARSCTNAWSEQGVLAIQRQLDRLVAMGRLKIADTRRASYWFMALAVPSFVATPLDVPELFHMPEGTREEAFEALAADAARIFLCATATSPEFTAVPVSQRPAT